MKKRNLYILGAVVFFVQSAFSAQNGRIVGGQDANVNDWPSAAAIMWSDHQGCGGSLIAPTWVLTAAHCFDASDPDAVILGRSNLSTEEGERINIEQIIIHPNYNSTNFDNDIALIELSTPSTQQPTFLINPIDMGLLKSGNTMTVVGWGNLSEGGPSSDVLQEVDVELIAQETCSGWYENIGGVTANQFCAGLDQGGRDSCQADSGGPIFALVNGEIVQTGIVSWGIGCAQEKKPGVYTQLSNYLNWISQSAQLLPDYRVLSIINWGCTWDKKPLVVVEVENRGEFIAPPAWIDIFAGLPSPPKIGTLSDNYQSTGWLNAGDTRLLWFSFDQFFQNKLFWVDVFADTDQGVEEENESNNHQDNYIFANCF